MRNSQTSINYELEFNLQQQSLPSNFSFSQPFVIQPKANTKSFSYSINSSWLNLEILHYLVFIEINEAELTKLVPWAIFKQMAAFVGTRNPNQCRIYHQKLMKVYSSITQILIDHKSILLKNLQAYEDLKEKFYRINQQQCNKAQDEIGQNLYTLEKSIKYFYENNKREGSSNICPINQQPPIYNKQINQDNKKTGTQYEDGQKQHKMFKQKNVRKSFDLDAF